MTQESDAISIAGLIANTSKTDIRKGNVQVTTRNDDAYLPQSGVRSKRMDGNCSKGIKISANKSVVGVQSFASAKHASADKSTATGASGMNGVVSNELRDAGERRSEPSSLLQVNDKVVSKDVIVSVPSKLNLEKHTAVRVVPQDSFSTKAHMNEACRTPYLQRKKPVERDELEVEEWIQKLSTELNASGASGVVNSLSHIDSTKQTDSSVQWRDNTVFDSDGVTH
ncbi:hypothetical protein V6N13_023086 [Hibiscus sabdariffa]|uniref:Uncharacterized protein n=2 Tax=Hibiscus sabdariffa TaxID=183260 RepID=A0ABR2A8S0_9ROSI